MTSPDRRVLLALDRKRGCDLDDVRRTTRLAVATLRVTLRKLERMRLVAADAGEPYRLTAKGKRIVKSLRAAR